MHPGGHLSDELQALGMSAAELARQLKVPTNRLTEIINGRRAVTGDTALRLGHFFGTSPQFWLNLQALYDLHAAEQALSTLKRGRGGAGRAAGSPPPPRRASRAPRAGGRPAPNPPARPT